MKCNDNKIVIAVGKENMPRKDIIDTLRCRASVEEALLSKGFEVETLFLEKSDFEDIESIKGKILELNSYCVFNIFEGYNSDSQKEAEFIKILEDLGISFTGNFSYTLRTCLDKEKMKHILKKNNIPHPQGIFISNVKSLDAGNFNFPLFIKPCFEDASVGIDRDSLITRKEDLYAVVERKINEFPSGLLLEEFIPGKEYNVGFLGDFPYELLGISVIDYAKYEKFPPFMTYISKWESSSSEFKKILPTVVRKIDQRLREKIVGLSKKAGRILKCRSYFRVDLREKYGELFVLDVNPNPDINLDSGFMRQAYYKGYSYGDVVEKILNQR